MSQAPNVSPDDLRHEVGRETAFQALAFALIETHPNPHALAAAFEKNSEFLKAHLLGLPLSDVYLDAFDSARKQIADQVQVACRTR